MAFTTADIDAIDRAIASGELIVRMGDRQVQYRTLDELLAARDRISAVIAAQSSTSRAYPRYQQASFADE
jgi:hypothetical protein